MRRLYNRLYYVIAFRPAQTTNQKMKGNEHYLTNKQLAQLRTKEALKFLTFRNVVIYKTYKLLNKWSKRKTDVFN
jgi:hypothetical protein